LLKNLFGAALLCSANRFVRQQQRDEIMQCFALIVNFFSIVRRVFRGFPLSTQHINSWWRSAGGEL
jgi:hypothetical protein